MTHEEYLEHIEALVHQLVEASLDEPWFSFDADEAADRHLAGIITAWQLQVCILANQIRILHTDHDGCIPEAH